MRLEHLSAVAVAKDGRNHQILAQTPTPLHKVIWRAYLADKYYQYHTEHYRYDGYYQYKSSFSELPELLYAWPQEEFVLRDVMPCFPQKLEGFAC